MSERRFLFDDGGNHFDESGCGRNERLFCFDESVFRRSERGNLWNDCLTCSSERGFRFDRRVFRRSDFHFLLNDFLFAHDDFLFRFDERLFRLDRFLFGFDRFLFRNGRCRRWVDRFDLDGVECACRRILGPLDFVPRPLNGYKLPV